MKIILGNVSDDKNKIRKTFTNQKEYNGLLRDGSDVLNPIIEVSGNNLSGYNYLYIPDFSRYYFVTMKNLNKNRWEITGIPDPLFSQADAILSLFVTIDKQEQQVNSDLYINDDTWVCENRGSQSIVTFPGKFLDNGQFILITAGA